METTNKIILRDLKSADMFPMFRIISKIGINEFRQCFESSAIMDAINSDNGNDSTVANIGFAVLLDIAGVICSHISDAEKDIFSLMASLADMKVEDIASLDMVTFTELVVDLIRKEQFKDFIKVVSKLFK